MKNKTCVARIAKRIILSVAVASFSLFCIGHTGCQITSEGIKIIEGRVGAQISGVQVLSEKSIEVDFDTEVSVSEAMITPLGNGERASLDMLGSRDYDNAVSTELSNNGKKVIYKFSKETAVGKRYQLFSQIKYGRDNSLTFALPFDGFNNRVPVLVLQEIQGVNTKPKCEYILIRALTAGNLGGIELFSATYKELSEYQFPSVEVKAGETIMLHLRTYDGIEFQDELGENIALDKGAGSKDNFRDLYYTGNKKRANDKTDVILLRNKANMEILDAVLYTDIGSTEKFSKYAKSASLAVEAKKWKGTQGNFEPILMEKAMTNTTRCLVRANTAELLRLAKSGQIMQKDIIGSKEVWKIDLSLYNKKKVLD